jgi:hypothetical protein
MHRVYLNEPTHLRVIAFNWEIEEKKRIRLLRARCVFNDVVSTSDYMAKTDTVISQKLIEMGAKGKGRGLF